LGLGGEEGIEDAAAQLRLHAGAVIGDLDAHLGPGRREAECDMAVARHRIHGVDDEIEHRLIDLVPVGADARPGAPILDGEAQPLARHLGGDEALEASASS